jgi:hypothetical protein
MVLSIFATIIAVLAFEPVIQELGINEDAWVGAGTQAITARNTAVDAWFMLPLFLIGVIVIWGILSVVKRDYNDLGVE